MKTKWLVTVASLDKSIWSFIINLDASETPIDWFLSEPKIHITMTAIINFWPLILEYHPQHTPAKVLQEEAIKKFMIET